MSLVARLLEENGISTVIMGSAKDIVEYCGAARYLYTDFPLGNPCGKPYNGASQKGIIDAAMDLLVSATAPRTTVQSLYRWDDTSEWKDNFMKVDESNIDALRELGRQRMAAQAASKKQ